MLDGAPLSRADPAESKIKPLVHSVTESAILLGVSRTTIYEMHNSGLISIRKVAGRSVILRSDIEHLLETSVLPRKPKKGDCANDPA